MKLSWAVVALCAVVVATVYLGQAEAANCNAAELAACAPAISSGQPPSGQCCTKVREQRPCLCGYLKDQNLRKYVTSPNAQKVANACGVPIPKC